MTHIHEYFTDQSSLEENNPDTTASYIKDILVDADALVSLAKINDSNHAKAVVFSEKLQKHGVSYYVSPFTIAEVVTVLSYKISHQTAKNFLKQVRTLDIPTMELPDQYKDLADTWFLKQVKKGISYFDCYNMALLDRYKSQLRAIFSFDSIYKKNGFVLVEDLDLNNI